MAAACQAPKLRNWQASEAIHQQSQALYAIKYIANYAYSTGARGIKCLKALRQLVAWRGALSDRASQGLANK